MDKSALWMLKNLSIWIRIQETLSVCFWVSWIRIWVGNYLYGSGSASFYQQVKEFLKKNLLSLTTDVNVQCLQSVKSRNT
jgi:hypothetical protein